MKTPFRIFSALALTSLLGAACTASNVETRDAAAGDAGQRSDGAEDAPPRTDASFVDASESDSDAGLDSGPDVDSSLTDATDADNTSIVAHDSAPSTVAVGADGRVSVDIVSAATCDFNSLVGEWVHCAVPRTTLIASGVSSGAVVTSLHARFVGNCASTYLPELTLEAANLPAGKTFRVADRDATIAATDGAPMTSLVLTEAAPWPYVHYDATCTVVLDVVLNMPADSGDAGQP